MFDCRTEPLDSQRGLHLGVPVVEEVPHRQSGMVTLDPHPVPIAFVARQDHVEVAVSVHREFVDQFICGRDDSIHRLQPDITGGATVTKQAIAFPAAQRRPCVDAVRALHTPGNDVVGAGALHRQDRIRIKPQRLVDAGGQQYQQMAHP